MALSNLKQIILTAAMNGQPQPTDKSAEEKLSDPRPAVLGKTFEQNKIDADRARAQQIKDFLLDGFKNGSGYRTVILHHMILCKEAEVGNAQEDGDEIAKKIFAVACGGDDYSVLDMLAAKASNLGITSDDVMAQINTINAACAPIELNTKNSPMSPTGAACLPNDKGYSIGIQTVGIGMSMSCKPS